MYGGSASSLVMQLFGNKKTSKKELKIIKDLLAKDMEIKIYNLYQLYVRSSYTLFIYQRNGTGDCFGHWYIHYGRELFLLSLLPSY